jgi:hypothetical protein
MLIQEGRDYARHSFFILESNYAAYPNSLTIW